MATKKKAGSSTKAWEIGGAITAAAVAAAAGAYLLADKKTKTKAKAWVSKAKTEIAKHAKTAKKFGEKEYDAIVDQVVKKYGSMEKMTAGDVMKAAKDLKGEWSKIQDHAKKLVKTAKTVSSKKPATKKAKTTTKKKSRA